jgi:hypothetical protein
LINDVNFLQTFVSKMQTFFCNNLNFFCININFFCCFVTSDANFFGNNANFFPIVCKLNVNCELTFSGSCTPMSKPNVNFNQFRGAAPARGARRLPPGSRPREGTGQGSSPGLAAMPAAAAPRRRRRRLAMQQRRRCN